MNTPDSKLQRWVRRFIQPSRRRGEPQLTPCQSGDTIGASEPSSLYVNNPRHGYSLDAYSLDEEGGESVKSAKSTRSGKTGATRSVFDPQVEPATPQTSVTLASLLGGTTYSSNYTYNAYSGFGTRLIAASTINNNDLALVITLALSLRGLLGRSKSARRSVETFNSSTIGIPPSSILERLTQTHPVGGFGGVEEGSEGSLSGASLESL